MSLPLLLADVHPLATLNAALNGVATVLLVAGLLLIKRRRETAHKWTMLAAFAVSCVFLVSYVTHKVLLGVASTSFSGAGAVRGLYYAMLVSHVILAMTVPVLAIVTIVSGLRDRRLRHLRWARWTFPIWLYVSVTGVLIYWMLYHLYPSG